MTRSAINYLVDLATFALFLFMVASGLILAFILPPGSRGGRGAGERALWSLTRHDWGDIHFWVALGLIGLLILHVVLHWSWVCTLTHRMLTGRNLRATTPRRTQHLVGVAFLAAIAAMFGSFYWLAARSVETRSVVDTDPARHAALAPDSADARRADALDAGGPRRGPRGGGLP